MQNQEIETTKTPIEIYRELVAKQDVEIVDVKVPSGFVFKFKQPSKIGLLFSSGELPHYATSQAIQDWQADNSLELPEAEANRINEIKIAEKVFSIRDKVLELSYQPKIVVGKAQNENEFSTDDISNQDLEYLFKWVSAGGVTTIMSSMFPEKPAGSVGVVTDSQPLPQPTKQTRRHKG